MEENTHPEELEQNAAGDENNAPAQSQEDASRDRRSFLTRAAIGVAGAAGLMAIGAQAGQAAEARNVAKNKILSRIQLQMSQHEPIDEGGGDAYIKNSHSLYAKA